MAIFYEWYCIETVNGRERRRKLRWRMTEADAATWLAAPDNAGKRLEMVQNSGEHRAAGDGYVGWGQSLTEIPEGWAKRAGKKPLKRMTLVRW